MEQHNSLSFDDHGSPTYTDSDYWETVVTGWPCELTTTGGGESVGSRQVATMTSHIIYGGYSGGSEIRPEMRLVINGDIYSVIAAYDEDGDRREIKVEAKREATEITSVTDALVAGEIVGSNLTSSSVDLLVQGYSGGSSPYTGQWYKSQTDGFTPDATSLVSGETATTYEVTGLTSGQTYYFRYVITDSLLNVNATTQYRVDVP